MNNFNIEKIVSKFEANKDLINYKPYGDGHINNTFLVTLNENGKQNKYILQRLNTYVFKEPIKVMENISKITMHIRNKIEKNNLDFSCLTVKKSIDGTPYYIDKDNNFWRMQSYQDNVVTFSYSNDNNVIYNAGKGFGYFAYLLSDFDASSLHYTIPNFQNFPLKYKELSHAIDKDSFNRVKNVKDEIAFFDSFKNELSLLENDLDLPIRVTHNDTKLNNILLAPDTYKPVSVIDLDTVMPGKIATDFCDAIRSISANENEKDLNKIVFNEDSFTSYSKGFLEGTHSILTKHEIELLPQGCKLISLALGMRFLADYLNGNVYFKCSYEEENLHRALTQMKLAKEFDNNIDKMENILKNFI